MFIYIYKFYCIDYILMLLTLKYFLDGCESLIQNDAVYIYDLYQWKYVCADQMTQQTANVICKESYNSSASNYTSILMSSANYDFPIVGYSFNCTGSESSLCECQRVANSCSNMEIVQVICNTPGKDIRNKLILHLKLAFLKTMVSKLVR